MEGIHISGRDKAEHYFQVYKIPRKEKVSKFVFIKMEWPVNGRDGLKHSTRRKEENCTRPHLNTSSWLNGDHHLWSTTKDNLLRRVQSYIEEFRQLQIMVRGWSKEALIGTFVDG